MSDVDALKNLVEGFSLEVKESKVGVLQAGVELISQSCSNPSLSLIKNIDAVVDTFKTYR